MERLVDVDTPLGSALWFRQMTGTEALSSNFEFDVTFHSKQSGLSAKAMLGQPVTLKVETEGKSVRHFNGICTRFASSGREGEHLLYSAKLRPWLWIASRRTDCRIFQKMTVPEIIKKVLDLYQHPMQPKLTKTYRQWDYCVQYQESDLNFVMRLMEHEGIYFYFEHSASNHTLVFADDMDASHSALPGKSSINYFGVDAGAVVSEEHFNSWVVREEIDSGEYFTDDYDFEHPSSELNVKRQRYMSHSHDKYQVYDWPGGYVKHGDGDAYAQRRMDMLAAEHERTQGHTTVRTMAPGYRFTLQRCPRQDQNREYLAVAATYFFRDNARLSSGSGDGDADWGITVTSQPSSIPYRSQLLTPKPRTHGPQTAVVVGPKGEEIYTDKYGRVKVQFHWDRIGQKNEDSSCWIRVAAPWAGEKWGMVHIPRIGQEVVVDFIGGDPDYPLITGSVYNAEQMPPYGLPENKSASGLKSRATKGASATDFNEIRMEDFKGKEQLYVHAQRNYDTVVELDSSVVVGHDRNTRIGNNDSRFVGANDRHVIGGNQANMVMGTQSNSIGKNQDTAVGGSQSNMVAGSKIQSIGGVLKEKTGGDHRESIGGRHTFTVSSDEKNNVGGKQLNFIQGGRKSIVVGKEVVLSTGKTTHFAATGYSVMTPTSYSEQCLTRKATVLGTDDTKVVGMQTTKVGGVRDATIGGADSTKVAGAKTTTVGGANTVTAGAAISLTAGAAISLTAGGILTITAGGVTTITSGGAVAITAPAITLNAPVVTCAGVFIATTVIATSVVSPLYTPGVGNLF